MHEETPQVRDSGRPPAREGTAIMAPGAAESLPARRSIWSRARHNSPFMFGAVMFLIVALIATLVPFILQLDPYAVDTSRRLSGIGEEGYLLGSDDFGRDLLARLLVGAQTSLIVGASVAVLSGVLGTVIGICASYFRVMDHILMRVCDGLMAIPAILLAIALAAALGPSVPNLILALTVVFTPNVARLVRSRALAVLSETFVEASRVQGAPPLHIILRHVLPNTLSVLTVQVTFIFADSIITEAALSFLGAGVPTPEPSWGNILNDGRGVILQFPLMTVAASLSLVITVLALNLLGDGLRDLVDPRSSGDDTRRGMVSRLFGRAPRTTRRPRPAATEESTEP